MTLYCPDCRKPYFIRNVTDDPKQCKCKSFEKKLQMWRDVIDALRIGYIANTDWPIYIKIGNIKTTAKVRQTAHGGTFTAFIENTTGKTTLFNDITILSAKNQSPLAMYPIVTGLVSNHGTVAVSIDINLERD